MNESSKFNVAVRGLSAVVMAVGLLGTAAATAADKAAARPEIAKLTVFPATLELNGPRDSRRLIVTGYDAGGRAFDVSSQATLNAAGPQVVIDADGFISPKQAGETRVIVEAGGKQFAVKVVVKTVAERPISFIREIVPIISRVGCNAGTCHGAQKGKNGFKLSLRGYDPLFDYRALIDDLSGRRFNRSQPSQSLMLLKPTQGVGMR